MAKANGCGVAGMAVIETRDVDGWRVGTAVGQDEPMVEDIELAGRLGFGQSYDIRKLIKRHISAGNLNDSEVFATVSKTSPMGGRPATCYWLSEAGALFVVTKSETPKAVALTKELIRVFMLARRGQLGQAVIGIPREQYDRELAIRDEQIAQLQRLLVSNSAASSGVISPEDLTRLRHEIRYIGSLWTEIGIAKSDPAGIMLVRHRVLDRWFGAGKSYDTIPRHLVAEVFAQLKVMRRDAERRLTSERKAGQILLKFPFAA